MKIYTFHSYKLSGQLGSEMSMQTQMLSTKDAELKGAREEVHRFFFLVLLRDSVPCLRKNGCVSYSHNMKHHGIKESL